MIKTLQRSCRTNFFGVNRIKSSCYSSQPAIKKKHKYEDAMKEFENISNISPKLRVKLPQKPPFAKNLLLGIFDTDILPFPELRKDDWENLEKNMTEIIRFLEQPEVKEENMLSKQLLTKLSSQKLIGLQSSQLIGGRDMNVSESFRVLEALSEINSKGKVIFNETLAIQILQKFGNEKLQKKYLDALISGKVVAGFCIVEPLLSNIDTSKRTAILSNDGKSWVLNGSKKAVVNGTSSDIFIGLAHTESITKDEIEEQKFTAFVVERDFGGVTTTQKNALNSTFEIADIIFDNTRIPAENVIGNIGTGENILTTIYPEYRLSLAIMCNSLNKKLVNNCVDHFIRISQEPVLLYETDAVSTVIAEFITSSYAMESMIYLTSGLMDNYENQDCELEAICTKVFASEQALQNTTKCFNLIGTETILDDHWCSDLHKEALCHASINDANDSLKVIMALLGLRYAGNEINKTIKKIRNPLFHAGFIFKRMWTHRNQGDDNPKLNLYLHHYLHPSLITASNHLEYCVLRLQYATETLLSRYGPDVIYKHLELRRLAEVIIDVYAMTACVSRASRSYCIGLQHSDFEIVLASSVCVNARERVKANIKKIVDGPHQTNDENYRMLSKRLFKFKKYFPVHPLTRNF